MPTDEYPQARYAGGIGNFLNSRLGRRGLRDGDRLVVFPVRELYPKH